MKIGYWTRLRPSASEWRNVLADYDAVVYEIDGGPIDSPLRDALVEWPGLLVLGTSDLDASWSRALDRAIAVIVHSKDLEQRVRAQHPWTDVVFADPASDPAGVHLAVLDTARGRSARWLETVLESACAEIPGFFPGDRSSPWRREIEELVDASAGKPFQAD